MAAVPAKKRESSKPTTLYKYDRTRTVAASALVVATVPEKRTRVVAMRRIAGRVVQDCDVYIGRECNMGGWKLAESPWHNPYKVGQRGINCASDAVAAYERYLSRRPDLIARIRPELRGKVLGCWCKKKGKANAPCHGDVLVRWAEHEPKPTAGQRTA